MYKKELVTVHYFLNLSFDSCSNNLKDYGISGTIIISPEGVNGTISAKNNNLLKFNKLLKKILSIKKYNSENKSNSKFNPFYKPKVKIKWSSRWFS